MLLFSWQARAQITVSADSLFAEPEARNAIALYHQSVGYQSPLYNGVRHEGYRFDIKGHAYLETKDWKSGSLNYDGIVYENVPMLYDEVKDELIINHVKNSAAISLISERVSGFNLSGHTFIYLRENSEIKPGFYEILYSGKASLLCKREKYIEENVNQLVIDRSFRTNYQYFVKKEDRYYHIKNNKSLLEAFEDKEKEIRLFIRQNHLNFKLDPEATLMKVTAYYDQITRS